MEGEGGGRAPATGSDGGLATCGGVDRAQGVTGVLHQNRAPPLGQGGESGQVDHLAAQMHGQHGGQPATAQAIHRRGEMLWPHETRGRVHVGEHHLGADISRAVGRRQEGGGRHDADIALADAQRQHRYVQGCGAVDAGHRVRRPDGLGELGLEGGDLRPGGQEVRPQRLGDGGDVVVLNHLAPIGQEGLGHGLPPQSVARRRRPGVFSATRSRSACPVSHSSLVSLA